MTAGVPSTDVLLRVAGLRKSFVVERTAMGKPKRVICAVDDVSFELAECETLAIVGESGTGKSTVGRLVLRLVKADGGSVFYRGEDIFALKGRAMRRLRTKMRMIFQDPFSSMDPRMSISQIVAEPLLVHERLSARDRRVRVATLLERVGISGHQLDRRPYEFSGGQLQRVAIARAISTGPDLLVCDEPVAALDMSIRAQVLNLLDDLQQEFGIAMLFISHDLSLVEQIATRTAVMFEGRIVELQPTADLFKTPQHAYTKKLLRSIPAVRGRTELLPPDDPPIHGPLNYKRAEAGFSSPQVLS